MKLSTRARYALRMMFDVWRTSNGGKPVRLEEVANRTGISRRYLDQLVLPLKNASLLRGVKGPGGGYLLGRAAEQIRLDEIVEAEIGPIAVVDCVASDEFCDRTEDCACRLVYSLVSHRVRSALGELTLADLADKSRLDAIRKELAH